MNAVRRLTDDEGKAVYEIPDRPAYPEKVTHLPTDDRGVRLSLSVRPYETNLTDWQGSLEVLATISSKKLNVHREVEHRWTNITPLLFAFYSDGAAIAKKSDGFAKLGGTNFLVELAEPGHPHTWRLYLNQTSLLALLPHHRPQQVTIVSAFAERQQTAYFGPSESAQQTEASIYFDKQLLTRMGKIQVVNRKMVLVRSDPVTLRWTGERWQATD